MDRGVWCATVHGVTKSHTKLSVGAKRTEGTDEGRGTKDEMMGSWNMVIADRAQSKVETYSSRFGLAKKFVQVFP